MSRSSVSRDCKPSVLCHTPRVYGMCAPVIFLCCQGLLLGVRAPRRC